MIRTALASVALTLICSTAAPAASKWYAAVVDIDKPATYLNFDNGSVASATPLLDHAMKLDDLRDPIAPMKLAPDATIEWWQYVPTAESAQPIFVLGDTMISLLPNPKAKPKDQSTAAIAIASKEGKPARFTPPITAGKWYYLALVRSKDAAKLYVNGQDGGAELAVALPDDLKLASDTTGQVVIDELAVYDHALLPERLVAHFKSALPPRKIVTSGHRGDNHGSPENTNISYVNAIANKTPIVEMDLRLTKDNVLVLLHDPTLNRTSDGKGPIVEMNLADVEKLDAGSWKDKAKYKGEPIPKVETIANTCRDKAIMMLDLKCTGLGQSLADLKQKLSFPSDQWILAPWEDDEGVALRKYLPDVPMIRLTSKIPTDKFDDAYFARMKQIGFSGFSVNWQQLNEAFINAAHKNGMKVHTWTINDAPDIAGAVLANVDGVITDDAPTTMKLIAELSPKP